MTLQADLQSAGWYLSEEGIDLCCQGLTNPSVKDVIKKAQDLDFKEVGRPSLPDDINRGRVERLEGNLVLMVTKIRNVAAPKVKEESGAAPRMLKISLTDGTTTCHAVEMTEIKSVSLKTPPGTKIKLKAGQLEVANGFVKISEKNLEVIGGEVEALVERWKVNQSLAEFTRSGMTGDGGQGPPKWLPFGQKNKMPQSDPNNKNFKSIVAKPTEAGEDGEFERARQEAVQEAAKGEQKKFGAGSKNIKESKAKRDEDNRARREEREKSKSVENTEFEAGSRGDQGERGERGGRGRGGRGRGRGRGRRDREEEEDSGQAAPSQPSLFDFLQDSIPVSASVSTTTGRLESKESEKYKARPEDNVRSETRVKGERGEREHKERDRPKTGKDRDRERERRDNQDKRGQQGDHRQRDEGRKKETSSEGADRKNNRKDAKNSQSRSNTERKDFNPIFHGRSNGSDGLEKLDKYERSLFAEDSAERSSKGSARNQSAKSHHQQRENSRTDFSQQSRQPSYNAQNYPPLGGKQTAGNDQDFGQWNGNRHQREDLGAALQNMSLGPAVNRGGSQPQRGGRNGHYQQDRYNGGGGGGGGGGYQRHNEERPEAGHNTRRGEQGGGGGGGARQTWQKGAKCRAKYWEDEQYYTATITGMSNTTAVVHFDAYGNHEEVLLKDLLPLGKKNFGPTPGHSGAFRQ